MPRVELPKILFLTLDIARFYRNNFFNTNDLAILSNRYKSDLVRQRVDKNDYKYLEDTRFGGLRGNFSTLLTWRGLVKRGSQIVNSYSVGRDSRLVNAVCNGKIILNHDDLSAHTNDERLEKLLKTESWLLTVRETQAHVKALLSRHPNIPLSRDSDNYPKDSVFKSSNGQYFIRSLVNNFKGSGNAILQYSIINLWSGKKFCQKNLHPLIVIPTEEDSWSEIFAIKNEDLFVHTPLLLNVDLSTRICTDEKGNSYELYPLPVAIEIFSKENENIQNRLNYSWNDLKSQYCENDVDREVKQEDEFSNFLRMFLDWNRNFSIDGKNVIDIKIISSGGPDVELLFSGGTSQKLELEHQWNNYLLHGHQNNSAFANVWIFAEEEFDKNKIFRLFAQQKRDNGDRIPDVFLYVDKDKRRRAYRVIWEREAIEELSVIF